MNPGPTGSPGGSKNEAYPGTAPSRSMMAAATSRGFFPARFARAIAIVPE